MKFRKYQKFVKILLTFSFLWILNGCSYQHPPIRYVPEAPPTSVKVKPEPQTFAPKTTIEPKTATEADVLKKTVKPKTKADIRVAKIPDKIESGFHVLAPKTPSFVKAPPTEPKYNYYVHKVQWPGETISVIAIWYTGTVKNWKALADANPKLNPKQITIGDSIFIPETLLTSRKPMPFSFLNAQKHKKSKPPYPSNQTSINSNSPKLFGPIETEQTSINSNAVELFAPIE